VLSEPTVVEHASQPYLAIRAVIAMTGIGSLAETLSAELAAWMQAHRIAPAGPPFFKYNVFGSEGLELEWGVPIGVPGKMAHVGGDHRVHAGVLPAGRYAMLVHTGPYDGLRDATAALLKWVADHHHRLDVRKTKAGEKFGGRFEIHLTDPRQQPDPAQWRTAVAIRLAD
jgi:effector-binding domain-containing protein